MQPTRGRTLSRTLLYLSHLLWCQDHCVGCAFNQLEAKFSLAVGQFWTEFARGGAPSGGWAAFTPTAPLNMALHPDALAVEINMSKTDACALWDDVDNA